MTVNVIQNAFNSGELSPQMLGRLDVPAYESGVKTLENWLIRPQGGIVKRSGTRFVSEVADSAVMSRLVSFVYSTTQAYILEFSDLKIRIFYDEDGPVADPVPPGAYEVATDYTEAELPALRFAQSADKLFIVHPDHHPAVLTRSGHTAWTWEDYEFIDGPYLEYRVPAVGEDAKPRTLTLDPSAVTGSVVVVPSADLFDADRDVGRMIRFGNDPGASAGLEWGALRITSVDASTPERATATVTAGPDVEKPKELPTLVAEYYWHLGAYYVDNYPSAISFTEGRLAFAGTPLEPERIDASVPDGWDDFALTSRIDNEVSNDSALSFQIGRANEVQVILWLASARNLLVGTTGGVWIMQASSDNEAVTPTNVNMARGGSFGCSSTPPVSVYNNVLYVSRTGKKILTTAYADLSYSTQDLTLMAEHVTGTGIDWMDFQYEPHSVLWCVRGDGEIAAMTFEPGQKIYGWHRHIIGGSFGSGNAVVESVAVIPAPDGTHDQVWMIVKRTINGSTVRHIEFMEQDFADTDDIEDAYFLDCGYTYDGVATDTITSGIDHLEGETVSVLADGATHPDVTVTGGAITLTREASVIHVGYSYNAECETLPIGLADRAGSTVGRLLRPVHAYIRLHRTLGLEYGTDADNLERLPFRSTGDPMDAPPPLFTGIKEITLSNAHDDEGIIYFRQSDPLPATILFLAGELGIS